MQQQIHTQTISQRTSIINNRDSHRIALKPHRKSAIEPASVTRFTHKVNVRTVYGRVLYDDDGGSSSSDGGGMQTHILIHHMNVWTFNNTHLTRLVSTWTTNSIQLSANNETINTRRLRRRNFFSFFPHRFVYTPIHWVYVVIIIVIVAIGLHYVAEGIPESVLYTVKSTIFLSLCF